jgi:hypothetical protein
LILCPRRSNNANMAQLTTRPREVDRLVWFVQCRLSETRVLMKAIVIAEQGLDGRRVEVHMGGRNGHRKLVTADARVGASAEAK